MSARVRCEFCGEWKDIPDFEGDGVYTTHICPAEQWYQEQEEQNQADWDRRNRELREYD